MWTNIFKFANFYLDRVRVDNIIHLSKEDHLEDLLCYRLLIDLVDGSKERYDYTSRKQRNNDFTKLLLKKEKRNDDK